MKEEKYIKDNNIISTLTNYYQLKGWYNEFSNFWKRGGRGKLFCVLDNIELNALKLTI